jgi:predicted methyltransferase
MEYYRRYDPLITCMNRGICETCQGRGWVLKPQAEQRVAMEDWALDKGYFIEHRPAFVCVTGITVRVHIDESREEALAHAICQAHEIK